MTGPSVTSKVPGQTLQSLDRICSSCFLGSRFQKRYVRIIVLSLIIVALAQTILSIWGFKDSNDINLDQLIQENQTNAKTDAQNSQPPPKYLTCIFGMWTGMANNIISIQTSLVFAMRYNRTLIIPPLDNWDVTPSYWSTKVENVLDSSSLGREQFTLQWGSEAFRDPYRKFSKYFQFETPSVNIIDMSSLDPNAIMQSPIKDSHAKILNNGNMWCWQNPENDKDFPETMEVKYPISKWDEDELVCIGIPFEIRLHTPRPRLQFTIWAVQQATDLLALNGLEGSQYLGIHLRRGNWEDYSSYGRFALSTFAKGSLKDDPIERRAPRDEHVIKAGEILRKRLAIIHGTSTPFPVVLTTNEKNSTSLKKFEDAGWIVLKKRIPDIPEFAQIALDLAVLSGATGFLGQYGSTFTLLAINIRGCEVEAAQFPCGMYFGDAEIV